MTAIRMANAAELTTTTASLLGHEVSFESNDLIVLEHVRSLVHEYRGHLASGSAALLVRIMVSADAALPQRGDIRHISHDDGSLTIEGADVAGMVDPARRESIAEVSRDVLEEPDQFRTAVLEPLALALISHFDRHPVHAAAIVHQGVALLLAGPGGAGKSTIAFAASRAGYHVLGDDVARVQLEPALRVWGGPARVRLRAQSKLKNVIPLNSDGPAYADKVAVCILGRAAAARIDAMDPLTLRRHLDSQLAPGFDRFPERHIAVMNALTVNGGYHLDLSANPADALPLIATMFERLK